MIHPFSCLRTALCLLFLVVGGLAFSQTNALRTENGLVSGTQSTDGRLGIYKGIPFAAPPVGELRWKAPQPAANWEGVRDCSAFPASAVQPPPDKVFLGNTNLTTWSISNGLIALWMPSPAKNNSKAGAASKKKP